MKVHVCTFRGASFHFIPHTHTCTHFHHTHPHTHAHTHTHTHSRCKPTCHTPVMPTTATWEAVGSCRESQPALASEQMTCMAKQAFLRPRQLRLVPVPTSPPSPNLYLWWLSLLHTHTYTHIQQRVCTQHSWVGQNFERLLHYFVHI